jgi:RNA ligase
MQFNPPLIRNINDVLPHIKDNPAFIVAEKPWWTTIDYVYAHRDTFTNDYARECRGLKFCNKTGNIIARPYHKFHNLGECAGYHSSDCDLTQPHTVLDKLDGSMVHTVIHPETGQVRLMTRMGESQQALDALAFLTQVSYGQDIIELAKSNPTSTFIFEYVGPSNRIVVLYKQEALILTGIRDILTGSYQTFMGMQAYLAGRDIPMVAPYPLLGGNLEDIYGDLENEGAVVRFDTGAMVKVKAEVYCRKHKSKELTETLKGVVQLIVEDNLDDILPQLDEDVADDLVDYQASLLNRLSEYHEGLRHILSLTKHMDQKTFAQTITKQYPQATCGLLFMTRKSGNGYDELINLIRKRYNKEADIVELFEALEFPIWSR